MASCATAGVLANGSEKLIRALPPAFHLLVLLYIVFLGVDVMTCHLHNTAVSQCDADE